MSLRLRLSLIIGSAFILIWSLAAVWMLFDLRQQLMLTLDQRLAASARMVAGLVSQLPATSLGKHPINRLSSEQLGLAKGLACQVSSLRGEVLARSLNAPETQLAPTHNGFHNQSIDHTEWRSFTLTHKGLRITTADRLDERMSLQQSILMTSAIPVGIALIGSLAALWFGLSNGLKPLRKLRKDLEQRSPDSTEPLQIAPLPAELAPLVATQNRLLRRIAETLQRERQLTDNTAHELRSPLTAIKTHLQVAGMTEGKVARQALEQAELATDRLHQTLEQLLTLARIDGGASFDDGTQCSALEAAQWAIHDCHLQQATDITLSGPSADHCLAIPASLAVVALRNLLDNACRHTQQGTPVRLQLINQSDQRMLYQVQDQGPPLHGDDLEHFTERFWRSLESTGSGLGLSIVRAIAERFQCELTFEASHAGLLVSLSIPVRPTPKG